MPSPTEQVHNYRIWQVITAAAVGTMIEWYDFYIFGSLAVTISPLFYPEGNDTLALIAYLSTFAVGFVVRPFGALFFGRIGDLVGRKYAFLVTLLVMGGATAAIGFLPTDNALADSRAAGTGAGRRVWWRGCLRGGTRAR
jgi:MFS family permease